MKKPQWITIGVAVLLLASILLFARTKPLKSDAIETATDDHAGHDHGDEQPAYTIDSILFVAKKELNTDQVTRITELENSISRGDVKAQQLRVYHQLSHFWKDTMHFFQPYAWYEAEGARLENSENSLTFAARLFLDNLQQEENPRLRQWGALQAKDLLERSLILNSDNDSAKVGIGATYMFGGISSNPMQGIAMITEVVKKDSNNVYAQYTLAQGAIMSGQIDKAMTRLKIVVRIQPDKFEALLMLADLYERSGNKEEAANWYRKSAAHAPMPEIRKEIEKRVAELSK